MSDKLITRDAKEAASDTFYAVREQTRMNFPDEAYRPSSKPPHAISLRAHSLHAGADGTGTKPELAERLAQWSGDMTYFETLAFDVLAMVADDASRDGHFVVGVANALDVNSAENPEFIAALARGMKRACDIGRFPLLNGETAELGYRTAGIGDNRLNWNAVALQLVNHEKIITGDKLKAGQPVIGIREKSIRSNGLTRARAILERAYLAEVEKVDSKREWILQSVRKKLITKLPSSVISDVLRALPVSVNSLQEHMHLPWHNLHPELTKKLLQPSTLYTPLIYAAQGGVDGYEKVPLVACAHVSGGGVPLKGKRMLEKKGLGMHLEAVFPDPEGIPELIALAQKYPDEQKGALVNERTACEQWNRGIGFMVVTDTEQDGESFVQLAQEMGYEAAQMGEVTDEKKIEWRGETWTY